MKSDVFISAIYERRVVCTLKKGTARAAQICAKFRYVHAQFTRKRKKHDDALIIEYCLLLILAHQSSSPRVPWYLYTQKSFQSTKSQESPTQKSVSSVNAKIYVNILLMVNN